MKAVVASTLDVALRLQEMASAEQRLLSAPRVQWLLFLAQLIFARRHDGHKLMPAHFVVTRDGPVEPNVRRCFVGGAPLIGCAEVSSHVQIFIEELWNVHRQTSLEALSDSLSANPLYSSLLKRGEGTEIPFDIIRRISQGEAENTVFARDRSTQTPPEKPPVVRSVQNLPGQSSPKAAANKPDIQARLVRSNTSAPRSLAAAQQAAQKLAMTRHPARPVENRPHQVVSGSRPQSATSPIERLADGRVVQQWRPRVSSASKHFRIETIGRNK